MEHSSIKLFQECNGHRYIEDDEREMTEPELKLHGYIILALKYRASQTTLLNFGNLLAHLFYINNEHPRTCFIQPILTKRNSHER